VSGARILAICNDQDLLDAISQSLHQHVHGTRLLISRSSYDALELVGRQDYDLILCDTKIPANNCLYVIRSVKHLRPWTPVIVIAGQDDARLTMDIFKAGAYDFLYKPLDRHLFGFSVQRGLEASNMRKGNDGHITRDRTVRIEGIDPSWTVSQLKDICAKFGRIMWARLVVNSNGEAIARGYVEMATLDEAREAIKGLDGALINNRRLAASPTFANA
jgi:DNA-binding NtrC family response regulator